MLPIANGGTGANNAGKILNNIGQGTYTIGLNSNFDYEAWYEVGRMPMAAANLTQRTTFLVTGAWCHGMCFLHVGITLTSDGKSVNKDLSEMQMVGKTNQMSSGIFAVDAESEAGVAILYIKIQDQRWYNFKILHQQIYANYSSAGSDIVTLPQRWTLASNYGAPSSSVRKTSITKTLYC